MKDNHNTVWDALNEFKSTTASVMRETDRYSQENPVIENKLLPADVANR